MTTVAPKGFTFCIKFPAKSVFLGNLNKHFKITEQFDVHAYGQNFTALPKNGYLELNDVKCWVLNKQTQGFVTLYFTAFEEWKKLDDYIKEKNSEGVRAIDYKIYRYVAPQNYWMLADTYKFKGVEELIGYDDFLGSIVHDIDVVNEHEEFLESIGEVRSLNYLLYGPPGTGKTTLIRTLASKYNLPIFIVNPCNINFAFLATVLNPVMDTGTKNRIILFEDFDRFLENPEVSKAMSQILNSLDGLDDKANTIRFFTGNNCEIIFKNDALINRMSSKFEFKYPHKEIFRKKLLRMLSYLTEFKEDAQFDRYLDIVVSKRITVRPFINFTIRYLFEKEPIEKMILHAEELNTIVLEKEKKV